MRLRRETTKNKYEFVKVKDENSDVIPEQSTLRLTIEKGLSVEDLIGMVIIAKEDGVLDGEQCTKIYTDVVINANDARQLNDVNYIYLYTFTSTQSRSAAYYYNPDTGILVSSEEPDFDPEGE